MIMRSSLSATTDRVVFDNVDRQRQEQKRGNLNFRKIVFIFEIVYKVHSKSDGRGFVETSACGQGLRYKKQ